MFRTKTHSSIASMVLGVACLSAPSVSLAAAPAKLSGTIAGVVRDSTGIPQLGATVILYNHKDRVYDKAVTDVWGEFRFPGLIADVYSVRVTLNTFMPALKRDILVQPGMRSILNVNLNSLFSTIQVALPSADSGLMSDEWKWVLRSSSSTRPVTRFLDKWPGQVTSQQPHSAFSETRGIFRVSAGEGPLASGIGTQPDLGTTFALATSFYGNNTLKVSGNLGYGSESGAPAAAFGASYSRDSGSGVALPELSLTMRQLFLPARVGAALAGNETALPMLRTMSAGFDEHTQLTDNLSLQYGANMDMVTFLDRLNYFSPYARFTYALGNDQELSFAFTSGNARPDLAESQSSENADLQHGLDSLGVFPNVTLLHGRPKVQRGEEMEVTYSRKVGSRKYYVSAYREDVTNAALSIVAPGGMFASGDILPDLFSGSSVFNAGDYQSSGYTAAVTQEVGQNVSVTVMYGSIGALTVDDRELASNNPDDLRAMIRAGRRHVATTRVTATSPWTGTHMIASYQWTNDSRWAMPGNIYSTQALRTTPGLNIYVRQPIPLPPSLPWRMEATADLRNMLAQGYLPINMMNGQSLLLVETPRSVSGGLNFIF